MWTKRNLANALPQGFDFDLVFCASASLSKRMCLCDRMLCMFKNDDSERDDDDSENKNEDAEDKVTFEDLQKSKKLSRNLIIC